MFQVFEEDRGLVAETNDPVLMLQKVPTAFSLGPTTVGMPHTLDECLRLSMYLKLAPPSPIEYYYDWPCDPMRLPEIPGLKRGDPARHQVDTAGFLTLNPHAYCLNGIGTMKTLTTLWAADYLMSIGMVTRALIVCPISVMRDAWDNSLFFHIKRRSYNTLYGTAAKRKKLLAQEKDFYLVNFHGLSILKNELADRPDINLIVIDELATLRNKTDQWKSAQAIIYPEKKPARPWVWGLTGAPTPNDPTDAFHQCKLITPHTVPKYYSQFRALTMEQHSQYIWSARPEAMDIVYKAMRPAIRYSRDECIDLPGEIVTTREVEMSAEQTKHYKELMRELYTEIRGGKITAVNEGVKRVKLLQICCGVVKDTNGVAHEIDAGSRIETLLATIEQCNEKVIVFVPFTEVTNTLYRAVSKHWSAAIVYGDVSKKERDRIFGEFQSQPDPSVLIAHPGCMAHGLTLTEASTIIWYAPVDSNDTYTQACGRITRPGQRYVANIVQLAGSAVERKMYKRLSERQSVQGVLLDMVEKGEE